MSIFELILLVIAGLLLIIAAIFNVLAASQIAKINNFKSDSKLNSAHKWLTWASVISWIGVAIIIVIIILYIYHTSKSSGSGRDLSSNWILRIFLFLILAVLITAGIFSAVGAVDIQNSARVSEAKATGAQTNAIIATVLSLAGGGLIIIGFIVSLFNKGDAKKREIEEQKKSGQFQFPDISGFKSSAGSEGEVGEAEQLLEDDPELLAFA